MPIMFTSCSMAASVVTRVFLFRFPQLLESLWMGVEVGLFWAKLFFSHTGGGDDVRAAGSTDTQHWRAHLGARDSLSGRTVRSAGEARLSSGGDRHSIPATLQTWIRFAACLMQTPWDMGTAAERSLTGGMQAARGGHFDQGRGEMLKCPSYPYRGKAGQDRGDTLIQG